ncbi:hypothetical protein PybrP1_005828 [[Pythium] brassicae (nom. inval.)]|nr:hypothetical protein PybrP1_005828 [[Pythium] brassicae (nom. inval.)]
MTYALLPPAVILLLLLTIPFPVMMLNKGIVKFGDVVFNIRVGTLSIFTIITTISFIKRYSLPDNHSDGHYAADLQKKATRWRSERNWWISALTFTIYWMLLRFHAMKKQLLKAQRRDDREFVVVLNCVLAALFFVMLSVVYTQLEDSIHVFVLLFIVVGLTVSINWFIIEANRLKEHSAAGAGGGGSSAKKPRADAARGKTD